MRIAVSNLAWDIEEDADVARLLARLGIDGVDIALGKYFADPGAAHEREIERVRKFWADHGVGIVGIQALFFGVSGLNMFGSTESRQAMLDRMASLCRIAAALGATRFVFGSFRNRDRTGLSDSTVRDVALDFFGRLGEIARAWGQIVCLEAIPAAYGANFLTTSVEAAQVVAALDHPAVRLLLDTGTMAVNEETPTDIVGRFAALIEHVHASEPDLAPYGSAGARHAEVAEALEKLAPGKTVTVEMLATKDEPHLVSLARALEAALRDYAAS
jgi:sugar phosphate isomerase/epimerase